MTKAVAVVVLAVLLLVSPALTVKSAAQENRSVLSCTLQCGLLCMAAGDPVLCILSCMKSCLHGKPANPEPQPALDYCNVGCVLTSCYGRPSANDTGDAAKACGESCSSDCKTSNIPQY